MDRLAESLTRHGVSRCDRRDLPLSPVLYYLPTNCGGGDATITAISWGSRFARQQFIIGYCGAAHLWRRLPQYQIGGQSLITSLSYTHFVELLNLEDAAQRTFYEIECIQGNWSVRELKRQIHSFYYQRCGLSFDKKKLSELTHQNIQKSSRMLARCMRPLSV